MKKVLLSLILLLTAISLSAQSLEDIVNNYTIANKLDKVSNFKTIKITAKTSVMGMDMPMEIWMKNPDKIKTVTSFNGQKIVQSYDGIKGYLINPMAGSLQPVEMTSEQLKEVVRSNIFQNYMAKYLSDGKLTLDGEENVDGKPAFKIKAAIDGTNSATLFIDKSTHLLVKTLAEVNQGGMVVPVESYPTNYTEVNGIFLPMKTTTSASGMEIVTTFTNVEVDIPIDDSIFSLK